MKLYGLITGLERKMVIIHNHHVRSENSVPKESISQCTKMRTEIRLFGAMALKCLGGEGQQEKDFWKSGGVDSLSNALCLSIL